MEQRQKFLIFTFMNENNDVADDVVVNIEGDNEGIVVNDGDNAEENEGENNQLQLLDPNEHILKRYLITFSGQMIIILIILSFCIYQLTRDPNNSIYLSIMTGLVGYVMPQPKVKSTK